MRNAIRSIKQQKNVQVKIIVVINGNLYHDNIRDELTSDPQINCLFQDEGNAPKAQALGRGNVTEPYFCFLDDDDELVSDSLLNRIQILEKNSDVDVVVCNGYREINNAREIFYPRIEECEKDPLDALFKQNWMASASGIYRANSIGVEYFDDYARYMEWTYMAAKLALTRRIHFVDVPCFVVKDTAGSISKSDDYLFGIIETFDKLLNLNLPIRIRQKILLKKRSAFHDLSSFYLNKLSIKEAWQYHLASLGMDRLGFEYALFTIKILRTSLIGRL